MKRNPLRLNLILTTTVALLAGLDTPMAHAQTEPAGGATGTTDESPETFELPVRLGTRIRVATQDGHVTEGTLVSWDNATARLLPAGATAPVEVSREAIQRLDRSLGERSLAGRYALVGGVIGAVAPALLLGGAWNSCGRCDGGFGTGAAAGIFFIGRFTIPIGALFGAAIGGGQKQEAWDPVALKTERRTRMTLGLSPEKNGGASAGLTLSWR